METVSTGCTETEGCAVKPTGPGTCEHLRQRSRCKECPGAGICQLNRERHRCADCEGASLCQHARQRSLCKECRGAGICQHARIRNQCKDCEGASTCHQNRERSRCKESQERASASTISKGAGASMAEVGKPVSIIGGEAGARHAKQTRTSRCRRISRSSGLVPHWLQFLPAFGSRRCKDGGGAGICQHNRRRSVCKGYGRREYLPAQSAKEPVQGGRARSTEGRASASTSVPGIRSWCKDCRRPRCFQACRRIVDALRFFQA